MSTLTIAVSDSLATAVEERMKVIGVRSKEEYLLSLVESDCALGELEQTLVERMNGPHAELEPDWREQVRTTAKRLLGE